MRRVSLVPRGEGCSACHLAETVHVGLEPVYVYDVVMADSRVSFVPRGVVRDNAE